MWYEINERRSEREVVGSFEFRPALLRGWSEWWAVVGRASLLPDELAGHAGDQKNATPNKCSYLNKL